MVGSGLSDKPAVAYFRVPQFQDFMDTLGIQQAHLIGNSMGGSVALKFAPKSPELGKLGLVSSFGLGREIDIYDRLLAAFPSAKLIPPSRSEL